MENSFVVTVDVWEAGAAIPETFAFGKHDPDNHVALSDNINPRVAWDNAPEGTQSFVILCHDPDVPSVGDDVNQAGKTVPADLPRVDFFHWVLVDIPANVSGIEQGQDASGVTPGGKDPGQHPYGITGINDYTAWFEGDPDMEGDYGGYDGPCPPWNDSIIHHYHFTVYALSTPSLGLSGSFTGRDVEQALQGHVLAKDTVVGTYTLNPEVSG